MVGQSAMVCRLLPLPNFTLVKTTAVREVDRCATQQLSLIRSSTRQAGGTLQVPTQARSWIYVPTNSRRPNHAAEGRGFDALSRSDLGIVKVSTTGHREPSVVVLK